MIWQLLCFRDPDFLFVFPLFLVNCLRMAARDPTITLKFQAAESKKEIIRVSPFFNGTF